LQVAEYHKQARCLQLHVSLLFSTNSSVQIEDLTIKILSISTISATTPVKYKHQFIAFSIRLIIKNKKLAQ